MLLRHLHHRRYRHQTLRMKRHYMPTLSTVLQGSVPCIALGQKVVRQQFLVEMTHVALEGLFRSRVQVRNVGWCH